MIDDIYIELGARLNQYTYKLPLLEDYLLILKEIFTPEEAAIAVKMPNRSISVPELSSLVNIPEDKLTAILERMADKGSVFNHQEDGRSMYIAIPFLPGIGEYQLMRAKNTPYEHKMAAMMEKLEEQMSKFMVPEIIDKYSDLMTNVMPIPFARVVPVKKEVESVQGIFSYDKVWEFIDREKVFSAAKCYCRHQSHIIGRECKIKNAPEYACLGFGPVAEFTIKYGFSKQITKQEAFEILDQADKAGLVHCMNNVSDLLTFMCNCCGCCCTPLRNIVKFRKFPLVSGSNFVVKADMDKCTACGKCVKRCQLQAITLEDKKLHIEEEYCFGCGSCTSTCPKDCLKLVRREEQITPKNATDPFIGIMENVEA